MKRISIIIIAACGLLTAAWATHYNIPLTDGRMEVTAGRIRMVEGWVPGYTKRIKLTVDNTKIDADLTNFPVTVFLTPAQGEEVFSELDADADYMKVAFAASDGTNQLYAEKELFDVSESNAIYHVSKAGWTISDSGDTDFYMYYYNDASDNTNYIGAINTTAGATVWDSNFKAVYHMADGTTSTTLDSTSNNNDATKDVANEPVEVEGKVGQAQDFDGTDDHLDASDNAGWDTGSYLTLEAIFKPSAQNQSQKALIVHDESDYKYLLYLTGNSGDFTFYVRTATGLSGAAVGHADGYFADGTYRYMAGVYDKTLGSNRVVLYQNGTSVAVDNGYNEDITAGDEGLNIGRWGDKIFDGIEDEIRLSSSARSAAWLKATYNSLWDALLSYGDEER